MPMDRGTCHQNCRIIEISLPYRIVSLTLQRHEKEASVTYVREA